LTVKAIIAYCATQLIIVVKLCDTRVTLGITTFSITTLNIITFSIRTLRITINHMRHSA